MESIIKKAIEGGYTQSEVETNNDGIWLSNPDITLHQSDIVLDPLFWQALGEVCEWERKAFECRCDAREDVWEEEYITYALRFHEINLTKGWIQAVEYLSKIIR